MRKSLLPLLVCCVCLIAPAFAHAQLTAASDKSALHNPGNEDGNNDWTFFENTEKRVFYIDCSKIRQHANDLAVRNANDEVIFSATLWDLPDNAIYELDMNKLGSGTFTLEIRTYRDVLRKQLVVK